MLLLHEIRNSERLRSWIPDFILLLVILLFESIYTNGLEDFLDIGLFDESGYLYAGITLSDGIPCAQCAPIYVLWYYLLSLIQHDPVELYYLNYKIMTLLPALLLFLVLRANKVSRTLSFVISVGLLYSSANFYTLPKVSHFAVVLLLFGLLVSRLFRDRKVVLLVLLMTVLVTSYVRPEYFVSFILLAFLVAFLYFKAIMKTRLIKPAIPLGVVILFSMILIITFGVPLGGGNRSMVAFGQHYAHNWVVWHKDDRNPWTNWETIMQTDFGAASSPIAAFLNNPSAVARHINSNIQALRPILNSMIGSAYPPSYPANVTFNLGMLIIVAASIVRVFKKGIRVSLNRLTENQTHLWFPAVLFLVMLLPVAIAIMLIAPRIHYVLIIGVLLVFMCTVLLWRKTDQHQWDSSYAVLAVACLGILLIFLPLSRSQGKAYQPNLAIIKFLRSLDINTTVNVLEAQGGYFVYAGWNYNWVAEYEKNGPFARFLAERSINMVVLSDRLSKDTRFLDDPEWNSFMNAPSEWGFTYMDVPDTQGWSLILKENLIHSIQNDGD